MSVHPLNTSENLQLAKKDTLAPFFYCSLESRNQAYPSYMCCKIFRVRNYLTWGYSMFAELNCELMANRSRMLGKYSAFCMRNGTVILPIFICSFLWLTREYSQCSFFRSSPMNAITLMLTSRFIAHLSWDTVFSKRTEVVRIEKSAHLPNRSNIVHAVHTGYCKVVI